MSKKGKSINELSKGQKRISLLAFVLFFAGIGGLFIYRSQAAPGACSTTGSVGSASYNISLPETTTYRLWVRMQVPDTTNTNNTNGVRVELAGNQCFTVTTTNANAVNQWQWINTDATATSTAHVTTQMTSGNTTAKLYGLKAGVKVDKVLLLKSDNTCTPSNDFTNGQPGENCTTPPPTITFTANPTSVVSGNTSSLTWSTTNATSCTASGGWTGSRTLSGSQTTSALTANTTFTLSCTGIGGTTSRNVSVTVTAPPTPTVSLAANPTSITSGSSSILSWSSTNATSCTASGGWTGSRATSGNLSTGILTTNTTFTLACTGAGGTASQSVTVTVTATPPPTDTTAPTITSTITGVTLTQGQATVTVNNQKGVQWQPLASDASGIKSFVLTINDQPVTLTNGQVGVGVTANGDYVLKAVATDNANLVTTYTLTVRIRHPDFNRSGRVDIFDMSALLNRWNQQSTIYDINVNGNVDIFDLSFLLNRWNSTQ